MKELALNGGVSAPTCDSGLFYQTLMESSETGIGLLDADGNVKYCMASITRILGYEPESRLGKNFFSIMHPNDAKKFKAPMQKLLATPGKSENFIAGFKHENGNWRDLEIRAINMLDNPVIEGIFINYRDVTESIALGRALQDSETRFRSLIENSFDGITLVNFDGIAKYHSPSLQRILGYSPEQGIGKSVLKLLHPDDLNIFYAAQQHWKQWKNKPFSATVRFKHKNESWVILEIRAMDLMDTPGIEGFLINYRDITESKRLESAFKNSEELYRTMVESAPEAIFIVDAEKCKFVDFNENAERLFGYSREELMKMNAIDVCPPTQPDGKLSLAIAAEKISEALAGGKPVYELQYKDAAGRLFMVEERLVKFPPYHRKLILGTAIDITERKRIKQALQESEERYRNMVENAQETIFIIDAETDSIVDFNESAVKLFGFSRARLLKKHVSDLFPAMQPNGMNSINFCKIKASEALRKGKSFMELTLRKSNGKMFLGEVYLSRFPPVGSKLLRGTVIDVTQKKEMEKKLRQRETEYRHLASVSPVGIFRTDARGRTIYVNEKWCKITGIKSQDAIGITWIKAVHPDDRKWVLSAWKVSLTKRKISRAEFRFQTRVGKATWVLGEAVPDFDQHGSFIGFAGSITDITERVKAEQKLAEREQQNKALLVAVPDLLFRISEDGTYLDYKPATNFKLLLPPKAFIGKKISEVMPPQIAQPAGKLIKKALKMKTVQSFGYNLSGAENGKEHFYEARIAPYTKDEVLVLVRDFTKQKEAEISLRNSEEKWRTLVTSAPQYIVTVNGNNQITFINDVKGLSPNLIVGMNVFDFVSFFDVDKSIISQALAEARKGNHQTLEISVNNRNGNQAWFSVKSAPVKREDGKVEELIIMALDITELKNAEQELRDTNKKLKALYQRLETIREEEKKNIAMEIHDELGQELTAMKLGMFWLQQYFEKNSTTDDLSPVRQKVKTLIQLSNQTIASVRKLAHQLRPLVLDNLGLLPAIEWLVNSVNESSKTKCRFSHDIGQVKLRKEFSVALFRIIQESLTNIIKHSGSTKASIGLFKRNNYLLLTVDDNGIGFDIRNINQSDRLGLFGIKEKVALWNGTFKLDTSKKKGTFMAMKFPLEEVKIAKKHVVNA